ncbi:MAG: hypothetical protein JW870_19090 [Candidatus Delongbacteria bacterium]|nr:hypothetical protein [Candidatus Delongbacteria bacterium]
MAVLQLQLFYLYEYWCYIKKKSSLVGNITVWLIRIIAVMDSLEVLKEK